MAVIRPAGAPVRRARSGPAPGGRAGSAPAPRVAAGTPGRSARRCLPRIAVAVGAGAALAAAAVAERSVVAASFALLGHVSWFWIVAAVVLESASMAAFAIMQRRLLAAGGARIGIRQMLATTYAANAVSVSIPLAGPELATAFAFRRFTRQGADAPLAGWSLLAGWVVSSAAAGLVAAGAGLASGRIAVAAVAVTGGVLAVAALAVVAAAARRPQLRQALERGAERIPRRASRLLRRPVGDLGPAIRNWSERLGSLRLPLWGWLTVTGLALANWLADAAVLAVSIRAVSGAVPWHTLLLAYVSGIAVQSLNVTPGGLGVAEGTLSLALVATGLHASQALTAVLLYRLASFWLVACAGWLVLLWLRRRQAQVLGQPGAGDAVRGAGDVLGRARGHDVTALRAAARAHVDEVVRGGEQVQVVVDDDDRGPGMQEPVEHPDEGGHVERVQPGGRLVEHV
jgi:putative heme transporter